MRNPEPKKLRKRLDRYRLDRQGTKYSDFGATAGNSEKLRGGQLAVVR